MQENMTKHTPGPWHRNVKPAAHYPVIFAGWAGKSVMTAVADSAIPEAEAEANHQLITAAPDLLEALRALTAIVDSWHPDDGIVRALAVAGVAENLTKAFGAARRAIVKAGG